MLTLEQREKNKEKFISLIKQIKRDGADIEGLVNKLENSDFFVTPASTQYHLSYEGGLCQHSLNVYEQLKKIVEIHYPKMIANENGEMHDVENYNCPISEESIIIVSLLHDLCKMNFYEISKRNVKDEEGHWKQVDYFKVRDAKDRFVYSTHGVNSEFMAGTFIPLKLEESVAIINHMGGKDSSSGSFDSNIADAFSKYPLALFLHEADMDATFFIERE